MHPWFLAYIDPGAGSLVIQATIAAIVTIPYFLRRQIARMLRMLAHDGRPKAARRPADPH
jgi:hypothetical protein